MSRRNKGATTYGGFDDDRTERHASDDPVAHGEVTGKRRSVERKLGDHGSVVCDSLRKSSMLGGIESIESRAQYRNRPPTGLERSPVGRGIDAPGQSADHASAASREPAGESMACRDAVGARPS